MKYLDLIRDIFNKIAIFPQYWNCMWIFSENGRYYAGIAYIFKGWRKHVQNWKKKWFITRFIPNISCPSSFHSVSFSLNFNVISLISMHFLLSDFIKLLLNISSVFIFCEIKVFLICNLFRNSERLSDRLLTVW